MSEEDLCYVKKNNLKRLTFDGINDLYLHPLYGSYTIQTCIEFDKLRLVKKVIKSEVRRIDISQEMEIQNEHCIEKYGCGQY